MDYNLSLDTGTGLPPRIQICFEERGSGLAGVSNKNSSTKEELFDRLWPLFDRGYLRDSVISRWLGLSVPVGLP